MLGNVRLHYVTLDYVRLHFVTLGCVKLGYVLLIVTPLTIIIYDHNIFIKQATEFYIELAPWVSPTLKTSKATNSGVIEGQTFEYKLEKRMFRPT
jgi:hypothetical protein